ncbi:MAG: hypothetical protein ACJ72N_04975 [Labedaea sp.]
MTDFDVPDDDGTDDKVTDHPITGAVRVAGVRVEVLPGGALSSISLSDRAIGHCPRTLAMTIVDAIAEATALANQRTRHALGVALTGLGLDCDAAITERVEATTPVTWRM